MFADNPQIYVLNLIPQPRHSPIGTPLPVFNFVLQQAVRSGRAVVKVYDMSMYEHFVSRKGRIIKPIDKYFMGLQLSSFGCLVFRECMF